MKLNRNLLQRQILAAVVGLVLLACSFGGGVGYQRWQTAQATGLDATALNQVYSILQKSFDGKLDKAKLLEGAKAGLTAATGDPYTVYLDKTAAQQLTADLAGTISGIGAEIGMRHNQITVIAPVAESPAAKAGVQAGDVIATIDGQDTAGLTVDAAVGRIRGASGTMVKLGLVRGSKSLDPLTITRATITVPSVKWRLQSGTIGYIRINQFGADTSGLMATAASELIHQGAKQMVLDLRDNPGGYLDAGIKVASQFLPAGKVVVEEKRLDGKNDQQHRSQDSGKLVGLTTVVLVNGGSASASEIVAGALHDNNVAKLVGEKTFGKGSVQVIQPLSGGDELKVTVAHWYTPKGVNISQAGITPDVTVGLSAADSDAGRDPQLDKAIQLLQSQL